MRGAGRWARVGLGPVIALLFAWLAFRYLDWNSAWRTVAGAQPLWLGLALALLAVDYFLRIIRWWLMLRSMTDLPLRAAAGPFLAGIAMNNVLPFRAGDVLRTAGFCRYLGLPVSRMLGTMVLERVLDLGSLLVFFLVGLWMLNPPIPPAVRSAGYAVVAGCLIGLLLVQVMPDRFRRLSLRLAEKAAERGAPRIAQIGRWIADFFGALGTLHRPRLLGLLWGCSLAAWLCEGALFAAAAAALSLTGMATIAPWFAMATGTLGTLIPSTPGYVGTFDYFTIVGFTAGGMAHSDAAILAILVHLLLWLPLTVIGLTWLAVRHHRLTFRLGRAEDANTIGVTP